jgi:hypothetical protein
MVSADLKTPSDSFAAPGGGKALWDSFHAEGTESFGAKVVSSLSGQFRSVLRRHFDGADREIDWHAESAG